jgi:hypothetical protein
MRFDSSRFLRRAVSPMVLTGAAAALLPLVVAPLLAESPAEALARERAGLEQPEEGSPGTHLTRQSERSGIFRAATLVLAVGEVPAGETGAVTSLNSPFTNRLGQVGFAGDLDVADTADRFLWAGDAIVWHNSDAAPALLSGAEGSMGIGDAGEFFYSPSVGGNDAVWSHNGAVCVQGGQAPGFAAGVTVTFNSRPAMNGNGRAYWVAGFNDAGGTGSLGRVLYTSPTASAGDIQIVMRSDDLVGGFPIDRPAGIGFDYDFSESGVHGIASLVLETGSTATDAAVAVDGAIVAREGSPIGNGANWSSFDLVSINDSGHYVFSGDSDAATTVDEFIAWDSQIVMFEGFTLDGHQLTTPATVGALSMDEAGSLVHLWSISGGEELLYFACEALDLTESRLLLATGDGLDFDGDDIADVTVTDFNASSAVGPGLELSPEGPIYVEVDIDDGGGGGPVEAIVALGRPVCMPFNDGFETGDTFRWSATVP